MYDFDNITSRMNTGSIKWDVKEGELPMWVADMDFRCAPEILKAVSDRAAHGIFGYTDTNEAWAASYVNWWNRRHGFLMDPKKLSFSTGVIPAIASIIRYFTVEGSDVVVMSPVYNIFYNIINQSKRFVNASQLLYKDGAYSIDFDDLEKKLSGTAAGLMILCNPHNPVGRIWTPEELERIGHLAHKHHITVVSDEIHCDITRPGIGYTPFASVNETNRMNSITCISPTKCFNMAGIQSAAIYADNEVLAKGIKDALNIDNVNEANVFAVPATVAAFDRSEDWLNEMCAYVFENRDIAEKYIEENIPALDPVKGDATYLMWVDVHEICKDSKRFTAFLRQNTGLFITAGSVYGAGGDGFVRINLACPKSTLMDGLARLKTGCDLISKEA